MYGVKHKQFLQHMLKCGVLSVEKALQFCEKIQAEAVINFDSLKNFTSEINMKIFEQDFKIQFTVCEVTGQKQIIFINTADDDISRMQNTFSQVDLQFFQVLMQELVISKDKKLAYIFCLSLPSVLTEKLSKTKTEKLIEKWIQMGYLVMKDNNVYLGARCIAEFTTFFQSRCKDHIAKCYLCSELVFTSRTCGSCKKIMHIHCLEKFLVKRNLCPGCKQKWQDYKEPSHDEEDTVNSDENDSDGPS